MEALTILLFIGAVWVLFALGLFAWSLLQGNHEHADRLALLPLEDNWNDDLVTPRNTGDTHEQKQRKAHAP